MTPHARLPDPTGHVPLPVLFDDCRTVRAHGELDLSTMAPLEEALRRARTGTGRLCLIVDLSAVTFVDGSLLAPLCEAWNDCRARHGWTRVVYTRPATALVFRVSGLAGRFPGYACAQDARQGIVAWSVPHLARGGAA
ncbi:STAS domain-containing protein [Streptomyces sp. cg28]|uniref:STAS domain-containing protein n=1 Tax=Streptomyces sp. cg28 TaxID=3403457 RepID=UPI003B22007A